MSARNYVPAMVKWMVEEGTKNTSSGSWIFTSAEIAEAFPVAESSVIEMFGAILTEVYQHEAVAEANVNFDSDGSASLNSTRSMLISIRIRLIRSAIIILTTVAIRSRNFSVLQVWIQAVLPSGMAMKVVWTKMVSWKFAVVCQILTLARVIMRRFVSLSMVTII